MVLYRDPNEPRVQKTDYGTVKERTRYRGLSWETYETGSQLYLSIGEFSSLCMRPTGRLARLAVNSISPSMSSRHCASDQLGDILHRQ
jgi:hypothetical protein